MKNHKFNLPIIFSVVFFFIIMLNGNYAQGENLLPTKFRDDMKYWVQGDYKDADFGRDMQYLNMHAMLHIPQSSYQTPIHVPTWVKHTVGSWLDGNTNDQDLIHAIQWLIDEKILSFGTLENVPSVQEQDTGLTSNTTQTPVQTSDNTQVTTSPTETTGSTTSQLQPLYAYALKLVNDDREKNGLKPVSLGNIPSAQNHADDLLRNNYFSHWNTSGVKPYVTYTKMGGKGEVGENISYEYSYCPTSNCIENTFDPYSVMQQQEYQMMNNDSSSNWDHRAEILDPNHTQVNFGIAYDQNRFYFVQNFETNIVTWNLLQMVGKQLEIDAILPLGYSFDSISVFSDPNPTILTGNDLMTRTPYDLHYYDQGKLVGEVVPDLGSNMHYQECYSGKIAVSTTNGENLCLDYITVTSITNSQSHVAFTADMTRFMTIGELHTIYFMIKDQNGNKVSATSLTLEYLK